MLPHPFSALDAKAYSTTAFEKGDIIFRQDDKPFALFYVAQGAVQLERHTPNGDKVSIHRAAQGQTFAEASLFSDQYHCDAVAVTDAKVVNINKAAILNAMRTDAVFANALTARFASQVQSYRHRLEIRTIRPANERVYCAVAAGMLNNDIMSFAHEIGLSHEAVYRALSQLVKAGRLTKADRGRYALK